MWCNVGVAEKISFFDIKIGDKITDHFTSKQINENKMRGNFVSVYNGGVQGTFIGTKSN